VPGPDAFDAPKGVRAIAPASSIGPLKTPEPEPEPEPAPAAEPKPEPAPEPPGAEVTPPAPEPPPAPAPEPEVTPPPAPEPPPAPAPAPEVTPPQPKPAPAKPVTRPAEPDSDPLLWVGSGLLLAALLLGVLLLLRRRGASPPAPPIRREIARVPITDLTPAEIAYAADQANALELRLDEEVRARVALEQKLAEAGEEIKVLRDKLNRVARRDEAS
jgi:hypothetical protein